MDYCNSTLLTSMMTKSHSDVIESVVDLYKIFVPILLIGCLFSLILNTVLVIVGNCFQTNRFKTPGLIDSRSPILVLTLNLAATDGIASLLMGLGLLINSFLPVVHGISIGGWCFKLVLEIFRLSALIASALHLLALALVHYKGIVNPIHYRSVIFCSQHRTRSIHLMSFICWFMPSVIIASYFGSIPCQGFQHQNCRSDFILTFRFRVLVVIAFFFPLLLMFYLYIRIFIIIKKHQKQRRMIRNENQCGDRILHRNREKKLLIMKKFSLDQTMINQQQTISKFPKENRSIKRTDWREDDDGVGVGCGLGEGDDNDDDDEESSKSFVLLVPETIIETQTVRLDHKIKNIDPKSCSNVINLNGGSMHRQTIQNNDGLKRCDNILKNHCKQTTPFSIRSASTIRNHHHTNSLVMPKQSANSSVSASTITRNGSGGNAKALVTTLLILGTYILCWMPAVLYFALTCIDHCYFPITTIDYRLRVIFSFIVNGLVILKAIVDPFIYSFRMKEMKSSLKRCLIFFCPLFCVEKNCPLMARTETSSFHHHHHRRQPSNHQSDSSGSNQFFRHQESRKETKQ